MRRTRLSLAALLVVAIGWASAQQPAKPPALPAVNPNIAKLEQTSAALDGPIVAVASIEPAGLVAVGEKGELSIWPRADAAGLKITDVKPRTLKAPDVPLTAGASAGNVLATASVDGKVHVWSAALDKVVHSLKAPAAVRALAVSADGKTVASAGDDGVVQLWNAGTGQPLRKLEGSPDWVLALAISPDGKLVAAGGFDGKVRIWEAESSKKLVEVAAGPPTPAPAPKTAPPPPNVVGSLAFSTDGKTLACGGGEGRIDIFNVADGKFQRSLTGHTGPVTSLLFHPAGAVLISASKDRTIKLWGHPAGNLLKSLEGHTAWVQGLALLDQGIRLASASADGTVRLWALAEPPKKK